MWQNIKTSGQVSFVLTAVARVFTILPAVGTQIRERVHGGFYCNSAGFGQLEGKLRWLL